MVTQAALDWLQATVNATLALDPEADQKLAQMSGRVIRIHIKLIERDLFLFPREHGMDIRAECDTEADATISGTPIALFKMGLSKEVTPMLLKGDVSIEGDSQLGRDFKKLLASLDIDWEELASRMLGDAPAHHLFRTLSKIHSWGKTSVQSVIEDSTEYVQEESRDVVPAAELENFYRQVDQLRDDVARLEKELAQMNTPSAN
jgi:ubiquinone biosynthesis protein UbiJ